MQQIGKAAADPDLPAFTWYAAAMVTRSARKLLNSD